MAWKIISILNPSTDILYHLVHSLKYRQQHEMRVPMELYAKYVENFRLTRFEYG